MADTVQRNCIACGQVDDHPRHVIQVDPNSTIAFHMDCHARSGCEVCASQLQACEATTDNPVVGDELRARLVALAENEEN
jgi:hypothetical protein